MNDTSNLRTILLEIAKVAVANYTLIGELYPFSGDTSLLQEVDDTVLVCDVRASTASQSNLLDFGNLRKLVYRSGLHVAAAFGRCVFSDEFVG